MPYDIIGDIHGQADKLRALLLAMDYEASGGGYAHPNGRKAVFVGDLIDRGPKQLEVITIVRAMMAAGNAHMIMGNHELNAIGYATNRVGEPRRHLRERSPKNFRQHEAFLEQVGGPGSDIHHELISWFRSLPVFLELEGIRVCHAWWSPAHIELIRANQNAQGVLNEDFLYAAFIAGHPAHEALEAVTKGLEAKLPMGMHYADQEGHTRDAIRVRWWDQNATTYRAAALASERIRAQIPDTPLPSTLALGVDGPPPIFVGHYWLTGAPIIQHERLAVLDYSAAANGPLVAYRWHGESTLTSHNLLAIGGKP